MCKTLGLLTNRFRYDYYLCASLKKNSHREYEKEC